MKIYLPLLVYVFFIIGCGSDSETPATQGLDSEESAQQIGEVMASIDEMGGLEGSFVYRHQKELKTKKIIPDLETKAMAAPCTLNIGARFSQCTPVEGSETFQVLKQFESCQKGLATFNGSVRLSFTSADCKLKNPGDSVTRDPDLTVMGRRGGTLKITRSGSLGQQLTRLDDTGNGTTETQGNEVENNAQPKFSFTSDGIRRTIMDQAGTSTLFDYTTETLEPLVIVGPRRGSRTVESGILRVTDHLKNIQCDYSPSAILWTAQCNCPTVGTWRATCTDGTQTEVSFQGCGIGQIKNGTTTAQVEFDRCVQ